MRAVATMVMVLLLAAGAMGVATAQQTADYPVTPVPFTNVTFTDAFWAPRLETVRTVTIPATFKQSEDTGRIKNFEIAGRVAVERGPLVYAAEWPDNNGHVINLMLEDSAPLTSDVRPGLLGGVTVVTGTAIAFREQRGEIATSSVPLTLIPYYAWAHRGKGQMAVWLAREPGKATPVPVPSR